MIARFRQNPAIARILDSPLVLPDAWLVAGCLAQTIWNQQAQRDPTLGITDYDLVYFDPTDLTAESETAHEARLRAATGLHLDVKNQARVHLWYATRFGIAITPYPSVEAAIATYPSTATAIGIRVADLHLHASFGLDDLLAGTIRANRRLASRAVFEAKAARWRAEWPSLTVEPWENGVD